MKMFAVAQNAWLRMVMENPWSEQHLPESELHLEPPSIVDKDRSSVATIRESLPPIGSWNCEPTHGRSFSSTSERKNAIMDCKA